MRPSEVFQSPENHRLFLVGVAATVLITGFYTVVLLVAASWLAVLPLPVALLAWWLLDRAFRRARVTAHADAVVVTNVLASWEIPWAEVQDFEAGRFLTIRLRNGSKRVAWAVQNPNLRFVMERDGYADEVAARLTQLKIERDENGA